MPLSLLIADDEAPTRALTAKLAAAARDDLRITEASSPEMALEKAKLETFALAFVDLHYENSSLDGFQLIAELKKLDPRLEIVVLSSSAAFNSVQSAMRAGASDYLAKGFGRAELAHALDRAVERRRWRRNEEGSLRAAGAATLVGDSSAMNGLRALLRKLGPHHAPVLIQGETGSGKELVARQLHAWGLDPAAPFVPVNCAAVPGSTADSFFFGHERGAFTGAERARAGVLEEADGGTLFLDEINSLPADLQGRLLRVLEDGMVRRMGGSRQTQVNFRLLAATNGDLEALIREGSFREDLYFRLNALQVQLPPLRERAEDILALAKAFYPGRELTQPLQDLLRAYPWPGNVRELRNILTAMDALAEADEFLGPEHIPEHLLRKIAAEIPDPLPDDQGAFADAQKQREEDFLRRAYRSAGGNVSRMARMLGADRSHLHHKLTKLGIHQAK